LWGSLRLKAEHAIYNGSTIRRSRSWSKAITLSCMLDDVNAIEQNMLAIASIAISSVPELPHRGSGLVGLYVWSVLVQAVCFYIDRVQQELLSISRISSRNAHHTCWTRPLLRNGLRSKKKLLLSVFTWPVEALVNEYDKCDVNISHAMHKAQE
jgi:hypothetical protein